MNKPIQAPDVYNDMPFPMNGIDSSAQFYQQRSGTTFDAENTRTFESLTQRGRGGSRPGLAKYVTDQLIGTGNLLIQHLNYIVDPAADALMANFAVPIPQYSDTSTNNAYILGGSIDINLIRNPNHRIIREGGSGIMLNRHKPASLQKTVPVITWADPADITVGTALSGTELNAIATDPFSALSIAGSFAYTPTSGTVLARGNHQLLSTAFTPTDTSTYTSKSASAHINVTDAMRVTHVSQVSGFAIVAHQTLAASGLTSASWVGKDVSNTTIAGTITLTPDETYTPGVAGTGVLSLTVVFDPTDTATYDSSSTPVSLDVNDALWSGSATIMSIGGTDGFGRIISVQVVSIDDSNLAVPADFLDVGDTVTAHQNGGATPGSGNIGETVTLTWDETNGIWRYLFVP